MGMPDFPIQRPTPEPAASRPRDLVDLSVKSLIQDVGPVFLRLFDYVVEKGSYQFGPTAVHLPEYRADHLFLFHSENSDSPATPFSSGMYLEYQLIPDPAAVSAWFYKTAGLNQQLKIPVCLIVLYLRKGGYAEFPFSLAIGEGALTCHFSFPAIRLWEHTEEIRRGSLQELAPLLALCEEDPDEELLFEEKAIIDSLELDEEERVRLLAVAMALGSKYVGAEVVERVFQEEIPMLKQLSVVEEWLEEKLREGLDKGREEGREEGRVEGESAALVTLLQEKFGPIDDEALQRIHSSDPETLLRWLRRVLTASTIDEALERSG